jgi:hypothetical protein
LIFSSHKIDGVSEVGAGRDVKNKFCFIDADSIAAFDLIYVISD